MLSLLTFIVGFVLGVALGLLVKYTPKKEKELTEEELLEKEWREQKKGY